ncbi:hypothetical protein BCR36DRAFT_442118, partial [Piromyces finnis]
IDILIYSFSVVITNILNESNYIPDSNSNINQSPTNKYVQNPNNNYMYTKSSNSTSNPRFSARSYKTLITDNNNFNKSQDYTRLRNIIAKNKFYYPNKTSFNSHSIFNLKRKLNNNTHKIHRYKTKFKNLLLTLNIFLILLQISHLHITKQSIV